MGKKVNRKNTRHIARRLRALKKSGYPMAALSKTTKYSLHEISNIIYGHQKSYGIEAAITFYTGSAHSDLWGEPPIRPSAHKAKNLFERTGLLYCPALEPDRPFRPAAECGVCEKTSCEGRIL